MQVASILSDLTSLRVCDHSAALALVSVHKLVESSSWKPNDGGLSPEPEMKPQDDPDLQRAMDLVELHYGVKMKHLQGEDAELKQARVAVDEVLKKLEREKNRTEKGGG